MNDRPTMRAVRQETLGGPDVLQTVELPRPEPVPTEILVEVHAAGVNPVDWKTRSGGAMLEALAGLPFGVGWDVSGVVAEVGRGVTRFKPGDVVFGMPWFPREASAYAEYVTAPSRHFARKPGRLSHTEAAGLPLAALTAWQILVDTAGVEPGQRVLVHAAAGGVGHLAVQIAKARGAYVLGTARAEKHDLLRALGVDEPIDYTTTRFEEAARDIDLVVDLIGGENSARSLDTLRPDGLLVAVPSGADPELFDLAERRGIRVTGFLVEPDHAGLERIADLVEAGELRVEIDTVFPLAEAAKAHQLGETGRTRGKIVLAIR